MRIVVQRVKESRVSVDGKTIGQIQQGMLLLVGIAKGDTHTQADFLVNKILGLRLFDDPAGKMNLSTQDINGGFLIVSQFTLLGNCDKGKRPSFDDAMDPISAKELYQYFVDQIKKSNLLVATGEFGAMMEVSLINDGPVTFILEK